MALETQGYQNQMPKETPPNMHSAASRRHRRYKNYVLVSASSSMNGLWYPGTLVWQYMNYMLNFKKTIEKIQNAFIIKVGMFT